jgi:hypothetical protein
VKLALYVKAERSIAAADSSGIRERWLWGLRLLADQEKITPAGNLKHGVREQLIAAAAKRGIKLSDSEIGRRLQCARAYPTEAQLTQILGEFASWNELHLANFPQMDKPADEPPADWRTKQEKNHDHARALAAQIDLQGELFPLSQFEPFETTLNELEAYWEQQEKLTDNFIKTSRKRREYLDTMSAAVGGDLSATWADAHRAAFGNEPGEPTDA